MRRGSPLPWLLLGITLAVGVTMAIVSRNQLVEEKTRTARALQANDEVMGRLRGVVSENQRLREEADAWKAQKTELESRAKSLEEQLKGSADEIARCKSKGRR
ncbi:MAG: hypothetical protein IPJ65_23770 [Archangiaceae bacterium]|nr:hypothetical protein [Archangiaceae bacterium]